MCALVVGFADGSGSEVGSWHEGIDECALAHAAVAAEEGNLAMQ